MSSDYSCSELMLAITGASMLCGAILDCKHLFEPAKAALCSGLSVDLLRTSNKACAGLACTALDLSSRPPLFIITLKETVWPPEDGLLPDAAAALAEAGA